MSQPIQIADYGDYLDYKIAIKNAEIASIQRVQAKLILEIQEIKTKLDEMNKNKAK